MAKNSPKELTETHQSEDQKTMLGLNYFLYARAKRLEYQNKRNNFLFWTIGAAIVITSALIINQRNHAIDVQPGFDYTGLKIYLTEICGTFILKTIVSGFNNINLTQTLKDIETIKAISKGGFVSPSERIIVNQIIYNNKLYDKIPRIHWQHYK